MNLNLSGSTQSNINTAQAPIQPASSTAAASAANSTSRPADTQSGNYSAGQVFSGEVAEINGRDVLLLLGNHQTLSARLEGDSSIRMVSLGETSRKVRNNSAALKESELAAEVATGGWAAILCACLPITGGCFSLADTRSARPSSASTASLNKPSPTGARPISNGSSEMCNRRKPSGI